jgi:HEAT repeat protein
VISSGGPPPGTPYDAREAAASRVLLESNGYAGTRQGARRAAESEHAVLRTAAFHLLAEDAQPEELELLRLGAADGEGSVRAWAAFGLEKLQPGAGIEVLRELAGRQPQFAEYAPLIAAAALARLGDPSGLATVEDAMRSFDEPLPVVRSLYWFAPLGRAELWPLYERALADATPGVRPLALLQLRQLPNPEVSSVLQRFLATEPPGSADAATAQGILAERASS